MATAYLGLGSNLGDRRQNLAQAIELISQQVKIKQLSSIYETEPEGYAQQPLFLNAACHVSTRLSPERLLDLLKEVEKRAAQARRTLHGPDYHAIVSAVAEEHGVTFEHLRAVCLDNWIAGPN